MKQILSIIGTFIRHKVLRIRSYEIISISPGGNINLRPMRKSTRRNS